MRCRQLTAQALPGVWLLPALHALDKFHNERWVDSDRRRREIEVYVVERYRRGEVEPAGRKREDE
jgi:hypothetical protein